MAIADYLAKLIELKNQLVANLKSMGVATDENEKLNTLVPKVLDIETGVDTSDATATAEDIRAGKTAYVNDVKVTGTAERSIKKFLDITKSLNSAFKQNTTITSINNIFEYSDTKNVTDINSMLVGCTSLTEIPNIDTSNVTDFKSAFGNCGKLRGTFNLDTSSATSLEDTFSSDELLTEIILSDTSKVTRFSATFSYCDSLKKISGLDFRSATNVYNMFNHCSALETIELKNISLSITFGSSTGMCNKLTTETLINIIREAWKTSSGISISVGTTNINKLSNVYVKLIDITDEMRAEDEYIDLKYPFEVCESTDTGAMLLTSYASSNKKVTIK